MDTMEFNDNFNFTLYPFPLYDDTNTTTDFLDPLVNVNGSTQAAPEYAHFRDLCRFWVKQVLFPIVMCIGAIGNGVTIIILTRRRMRTSTNHYLTALAFSDIFYLIFVFTLNLDYYPSLHTYNFQTYWCYAVMLADACSNTSVWLTVAFTIERYVAVCHPIKGKVFCTRSRAKKVIILVFLTCFLVTLPTPFEYVVMEKSSADNTTTYFRNISAFGENETYKQVYYGFTYISFILIPLVLLATFNTFLIRSVHQSKTQRRKMTMRRRRNDHTYQENRITIMLIAVVIMFMLCQLPTAVTLVYTSTYALNPSPNENAILAGLGNIFNLFMAINAAFNFVLYCAFSDKYRRIFIRTFLPCLYRSNSPNHSQSNVNTTYVQSDYESVVGSLKRGKSSKKSFDKKAATQNQGRSSIVMKQMNGYASGANGVHQKNGVNGSVKGKDAYLEVPQENGLCNPAEDSIGSNSTLDTNTTLSGSEHLTNSPPVVNGKSTTVVYHGDSNHVCYGMDGLPLRRNNSYKQKTEHVISLTSPGGNNHLL